MYRHLKIEELFNGLNHPRYRQVNISDIMIKRIQYKINLCRFEFNRKKKYDYILEMYTWMSRDLGKFALGLELDPLYVAIEMYSEFKDIFETEFVPYIHYLINPIGEKIDILSYNDIPDITYQDLEMINTPEGLCELYLNWVRIALLDKFDEEEVF